MASETIEFHGLKNNWFRHQFKTLSTPPIEVEQGVQPKTWIIHETREAMLNAFQLNKRTLSLPAAPVITMTSGRKGYLTLVGRTASGLLLPFYLSKLDEPKQPIRHFGTIIFEGATRSMIDGKIWIEDDFNSFAANEVAQVFEAACTFSQLDIKGLNTPQWKIFNYRTHFTQELPIPEPPTCIP